MIQRTLTVSFETDAYVITDELLQLMHCYNSFKCYNIVIRWVSVWIGE